MEEISQDEKKKIREEERRKIMKLRVCANTLFFVTASAIFLAFARWLRFY